MTRTQEPPRPVPPPTWQGRFALGAYTYAEAAMLAETTPQAVVAWQRGKRPAEGGTARRPRLVSYPQLIEFAVAVSFRQAGVPFARLHRVYEALQGALNAEYPFTSLAFKEHGLDLWPDDALLPRISAPCADRRCWAESILRRFAQFDYDAGCVVRWYVRGRERQVIVDPRYRFGSPMIVDTGVPTGVLRSRFLGGDSIAELADDYTISEAQVRDALDFEGAQHPSAA